MRTFRLLYLAPLLALFALGAWALASPVGSSPDDDFHLASIWCANSANTAACEPGDSATTRIVPSLIHNAPCFAHQPLESAGCQVRYLEASSEPTVLTDRGSFRNDYPPVYYAAMSVFVGGNIPASVVIMRFVNILIFVGLTTALFVLLPFARRQSLVWGWILSVVPLGLFLIASNNPSSWAIIGVGSAWIALLGYFESRGKRRIALGALFGLSALIAAGSRGDAAVYIVLSAALVVVLTFRKGRDYLVAAILPFVASVASVLLFFSSQQSGVVATGLSDPAVTGTQGSTISLIFNNLTNVPSLWAGVFGSWGLGWLDTGMPPVVPFAGILAFGGIAFAGLSIASRRKFVALGVVGLALLLIPTYVLVKGMNIVGQNVQPRYLLPLIVVFAGLAVLSIDEKLLSLSRAQLIVVTTALALAESISLYMNLRRYVTGFDGRDWNLDANTEWWWSIPLSPMFVWAFGSLAFAGLLVVMVREVGRKHEIA